jgi:hypothetical protein
LDGKSLLKTMTPVSILPNVSRKYRRPLAKSGENVAADFISTGVTACRCGKWLILIVIPIRLLAQIEHVILSQPAPQDAALDVFPG